MSKQRTGQAFDGILDDVTPRRTALPKPEKEPAVNIPMSRDLKKLLDRVIHHKGKTTNQKLWLTQVIEAAVKADPDSQKPVPGE